MKQLLLIFAFLTVQILSAQTDEQLVKEVVLTAYVGGIHNGGPIDDIRKGFHPSFQMLRLQDNGVNPLSIQDWIKRIEASREKNPNPPSVKAEGKFVSVTTRGTSANVIIEIYRSDKLIFTDHLLLYQFEEGWQIVAKTFYRH